MIDSPYRAKPGQKHNLAKVSTNDTGKFEAKEDAADATQKNLKRLSKLQELLYAEGKHAVLIVLQAMDTGGKDGAIEHVFSSVNPQGCDVTSFKVPTPLESRHDFLWRIHQAVPPKGMIGMRPAAQSLTMPTTSCADCTKTTASGGWHATQVSWLACWARTISAVDRRDPKRAPRSAMTCAKTSGSGRIAGDVRHGLVISFIASSRALSL